MFNPYPFYGYQPPIYPPQQMPYGPPSPTDLERGMIIAMKLRRKDEKKEERKKEAEAKKKEDEKKKVAESKGRSLLSVEWFILGILSYPFVGPAYKYLTHLGVQ